MVNLATAQGDWGTAPVEQLNDDDPHTRIPADPTAWFPALEVSTHWLSHPRYRAHQKVVVAQRLHAKCSAHGHSWSNPGHPSTLRESDEVSPHDRSPTDYGRPRVVPRTSAGDQDGQMRCVEQPPSR